MMEVCVGVLRVGMDSFICDGEVTGTSYLSFFFAVFFFFNDVLALVAFINSEINRKVEQRERERERESGEDMQQKSFRLGIEPVTVLSSLHTPD